MLHARRELELVPCHEVKGGIVHLQRPALRFDDAITPLDEIEPRARREIRVARGDALRGIADTVEDAEPTCRQRTESEVLLHDDGVFRHAERLAKERVGLHSVMKNVGEHDDVERTIGEGEGRAVERPNGHEARLNEHVDPFDARLEQARETLANAAIPRADIEKRPRWARKLGERAREPLGAREPHEAMMEREQRIQGFARFSLARRPSVRPP